MTDTIQPTQRTNAPHNNHPAQSGYTATQKQKDDETLSFSSVLENVMREKAGNK